MYAGKIQHKFDYIKFYRQDLDWFAFVFILLTVNLALVGIDYANGNPSEEQRVDA